MYVIAMLVPVIDPVAIQIGPINIHWYGLSYGLGLLLGWIYISSKLTVIRVMISLILL